nr:4a-hydroxytetrahydrobiopterin dehydratase [Paraglaciecola sp. G1-23]
MNQDLAIEQHWIIEDSKLTKTFQFNNFVNAFAWMTKVAIYAEKLNHHPEWSNVYNKVQVQLITHDAQAITELDFKLAEKMQNVF